MTQRTPLVSPLSGPVLQPDCWAAGVLCNLPDLLSYLFAGAVSCFNGTHFRLRRNMSGLSGICLEMLLLRRPTEAMGRRINRRAWSRCLLTGWLVWLGIRK